VGVSPLQFVNLYRNRRYFVIKLHAWFCLSYFLKANIKLYCIYQYFMSTNSFFNTVYVSPITNETSNVTTHATRSDPWPTLARSTSLFLICCYYYIYELFIVVIAWHALTLMYGKCYIYFSVQYCYIVMVRIQS
jgi:hypothetical protein